MPAVQEIDTIAERARQAAQRRDWAEASRCWESVRAISPGHLPAYLGMSHALRSTGRLDEAEAVLADGVERFPDHEQMAISHASLANARRDWPAALGRWESARSRFPNNPYCYLGNINALRGAGRSEEVAPLATQAETVLAAAKLRGFDAAAALRVEFEIARARLDWQTVRRSAEEIVALGTPPADVLLALAQACLRLGDADEADRAAQQALAADPAPTEAALTEAWMVRLHVATASGDGSLAVLCYSALAELNPNVVRWRLKRMQLLNWLGRVEEALSELQTIGSERPGDRIVQAFVRSYGQEEESAPAIGLADNPDAAKESEIDVIARKAPQPSEWVRPLLVPDAQRDLLIAPVDGAKTAVLIFTGSSDEVSMPLALFDRYMATVPVTAIYLKDFHRLRFLRGMRSLGNNLESTVLGLRRLLDSLGIERVQTLGNCVGGFAAIRYGVELGAERVIAFSPPTYSPLDTPAKLEEGRRFMKRRLEENVSRDLMDLQPFLETMQYQGEIQLFYEENDPRDRLNATRLSGLPGVHLHPREELSYRILRRIVSSSDDFGAMLRELLPVRPNHPNLTFLPFPQGLCATLVCHSRRESAFALAVACFLPGTAILLMH